jgi:hypothetical protein
MQVPKKSSRNRRAVTAVAVAAISAAALVTFAAPAGAQRIPEKTIRRECREAGGYYGTSMDNGVRRSFCSYRTLNDDTVYTDYYSDGVYEDTHP